jgi:protein-ribulosamine 3-kinase
MPHTKVDPAIIEALGLDPANAIMHSHGGSGFAGTFKIKAEKDGNPVNYFVKTGVGKEAEVMFRGTSLMLCLTIFMIL